MKTLIFVSFLLLISLQVSKGQRNQLLETLFEWRYFDFDWPVPRMRQEYLRRGDYNLSNIAPIDVDQSEDGRTFVTLIRAPKGVPATLNTVSQKRGPSGRLLAPYPDWSWHIDYQNCRGIVNVYRVTIDKCNRLWVLDTGMVNMTRVCSTQLLTFDLSTNRLIRRSIIPDDIATNVRTGLSLLITPVIEYDLNDLECQRPRVYMADVQGHGLVIMDENERSYRIEDDRFQPEERYANFTIAGEQFYLADGLFGLAVSPIFGNSQRRYIVFRPLASLSLNIAKTRDVWRASSTRNFEFWGKERILPSQATILAFSSSGLFFYALTREMAIGCWDTDRQLQEQNLDLVLQDSNRLQFVSGMKIIKNGNGQEEFRIMSNRLQKIYAGTMNFNEINFRILGANVENAVKRTKCDREAQGNNPNFEEDDNNNNYYPPNNDNNYYPPNDNNDYYPPSNNNDINNYPSNNDHIYHPPSNNNINNYPSNINNYPSNDNNYHPPSNNNDINNYPSNNDNNYYPPNHNNDIHHHPTDDYNDNYFPPSHNHDHHHHPPYNGYPPHHYG